MDFLMLKNNNFKYLLNMSYNKNCGNCGKIQTYTTKGRLDCSIRENWVCNSCSSTHMKKIYGDDVITNVVDLYVNGDSFSKISLLLKISRDNIKDMLIEKNVWVENRDDIKKEFNDVDIENIIKKYNSGLSVKKISNLYGVSVTPIKRILKDMNLLKKGLSDGKKIVLSEEQITLIKDLYLNKFKNCEEISYQLGLTKSFVSKYLCNCGYRRNKSEGVSVGSIYKYRGIKYNEYLKIIPDLDKYKLDVSKMTRQQPIHNLLNYDKRGNSGVEGAYHLDHKFSISEGFKNGVPAEIIGDIKNLEFITWEENIKKRTNCSITINELIN